MSFESYVCWHPDNVELIAPIDVASIEHEVDQDSSIFLATHHPLGLLRLPDAASTDGELIHEHALLEGFSKPAGNDPQITVISGAVGTGKSHMVKWLHAASTGRDEWHQVYIEKRNTNLRRVIETILLGLDGPRVSELREQLKVAASSLRDLTEAKNKVLHELSYHVEFPSGRSPMASDFEVEARRQLPQLLNDPVLSRHLLREEGAIHRITRLGLEGLQRDDENEHDLFFREADLPLSPEDLLDASKPAQVAIRRLASHERLRSTAVEVLNRELATAKASVFLGSGVELTGVFDEIRQELAKRDRELVIYIEDLVLLHGIDRELAQVFTEGRGKAGDRCSMRVAIAVTEGYLASGFETLTSRARHYSLNLQLGEHISLDEARTFVGRYLNAIRVGPARLKAASRLGQTAEWVPNSCDACDFEEECHKAFGADANGYGFYPLNGSAVDRLVELADSATTGEGRFDPRKVLRHVVRDPLDIAGAELPNGRFPSRRFAASLDRTRKALSTEVRTRLADTQDGDRRVSLLGFWAGGSVIDIVNLDPAIHIAFHLPEYLGGARAEPVVGSTVSPKRARGHQVVASAAGAVDWPEVEAWANEERVLPSATARAIRQFIFDAVLEELRSGASGLRVSGVSRKFEVGSVRFEENSVRIEAAQGGGSDLARQFEIRIDRSAKMAVLIKALLSADHELRWPASSDQQYADFVALVENWASELTSIASPPAVDLDPAVQLLALTSQPKVASGQSAGDRFEVMLQARVDPAPRGPAWQAWAKSMSRARQESLHVLDRSLSSAKGIGASSFIDAGAIIRLLDKAGSVHRIGDTLTGSEVFIDLQRHVRTQQAKTAEQEWNQVNQILDELRLHVDSKQSWSRIRSDVDAAIGMAHNAGLLPIATARADLADLASAVPEDATSILAKLERRTTDSSHDLWDLLPDPFPTLQSLLAYCDGVSAVLTSLEERLASELNSHESVIGPAAVASTVRDLADALDSVVMMGEQ